MKWIISSAVILCAFLSIRSNYPYIDIMSKCTMGKNHCRCMAEYINSELSYSEYQKFKKIITGGNVGGYMLINIGRDDAVSRVLMNAPVICSNPNE